MPPNRDEVTAIGASSGNRGFETSTFVAEDFCLIDDPPEGEKDLAELGAQDEAERIVPAGASPSEDKSALEDDAPETDPSEPGRATRLRGAMGSAAGALKRGAAGTLVGRMAGSAKAVGERVSDVSIRAGCLASDSLRKVPVRRLHKPVTSTVANVGSLLLATDVAVRMDQRTRSVFTSGKASAYDKALDLAYNTLKQHVADYQNHCKKTPKSNWYCTICRSCRLRVSRPAVLN